MSTRTKIGIAAFAILTCAAIEYVSRTYGSVDTLKPYSGGMIRGGAVLFAVWLAWRDLEMMPRWVLPAAIPTGLLVVYFPKFLIVVIPLILLLLFLQPKKPKQPKELKEPKEPKLNEKKPTRPTSVPRMIGKLTRIVLASPKKTKGKLSATESRKKIDEE